MKHHVAQLFSKKLFQSLAVLGTATICLTSQTQAGSAVTAVPVAAQQQLLASTDPRLAANKKLVFDFWREVIEAGQLDKAYQYLSPDYIQHNPNIADGSKAFVAFFAAFTEQNPVQSQIRQPLVNIIAEGPYVTLVFVQTLADKTQPGRTYTTTAFDMFRIADGKIAEHWDGMRKQ